LVRHSFNSWKIPGSIISHTYEENAIKLHVYLFLGWVLNAAATDHKTCLPRDPHLLFYFCKLLTH
jgi:hypothetical protein